MSLPRLRMAGVSKRFGATIALRGVSLEVDPGEVHALIGENGAGKSTLMKVLSGACPPDSGVIELNGERFAPENPHHAREAGIAMIYQELTLAPHLTVAENITLGSEPARGGWLNRAAQRRIARQALGELHHENISADAPVRSLTIAEQQIVEIARALAGKPRVIIMDEPTSSLTQADVENLFRAIRRLREGGVSVVYISHFLEECQALCQRYTVLRDGETVGTGRMASARVEDIIRLMVGRDIREIFPRTPRSFGPVVLELAGLAGERKPRRVDLKLRAGEILGLAGLIGSGRTETLRTCFGLDPLVAGRIHVVGGADGPASPHARLQDGIGLLSENRKEEGLMLNRSLADNLTLTRFAGLGRWGWISGRRQRAACRDWMQRLHVKAREPGQPVGQLSGGNQQKIAIGRLLHHDARIFLLDEPTRGIDVGSKAEIYRLMGDLAAQGRAVIFVSSYLPELLGVCDTIGVMCRGTLTEARPAAAWTEHSIMTAAIGQTDGTPDVS